MKVINYVFAAFIYGSIAVVTGCAHPGHERPAKLVMSDAAITTKVKSALLAEENIRSMDISVTTFDGQVQLSGFVDSEWQIDKASSVAKSVEGVKSVKNDLIHKPQ